MIRESPDDMPGLDVRYISDVAVDVVPIRLSDEAHLAYTATPESAEESSRAALNRYLDLRDEAAKVEKPTGEDLETIQRSVQKWVMDTGLLDERPNYDTYDRASVSRRLLGLVEFLRANHGDKISDAELAATVAFVQAAFDMYEATPAEGQATDADGSFAFTVPLRSSSDRADYGHEVVMVCPAMYYAPNAMRAQLAVGLPPLIVDTYQADRWGQRGYLILAPVFPDMERDLGKLRAFSTARKIVNDTVDFAQRRLGVEIVGLGAVLPALTRYGKSIANEHVITTTGHGGTTDLIFKTVEAAREQGAITDEEMRFLGSLGMGSIGRSITHLMAKRYKHVGSQVKAYDKDPDTRSSAAKGLKELSNVTIVDANDAHKGVADVINSSRLVVSAIVGHIGLGEHPIGDLSGKIFIDDSQPGSLDRAEVESRGGTLLWVVGHDTQGVAVRRGYDYGSLADAHRDVFGCEAEAAVLARYSQELKAQGIGDEERRAILRQIALQAEVTPEKAKQIGELFDRYGIVAAVPQVNGQLVTYPARSGRLLQTVSDMPTEIREGTTNTIVSKGLLPRFLRPLIRRLVNVAAI